MGLCIVCRKPKDGPHQMCPGCDAKDKAQRRRRRRQLIGHAKRSGEPTVKQIPTLLAMPTNTRAYARVSLVIRRRWGKNAHPNTRGPVVKALLGLRDRGLVERMYFLGSWVYRLTERGRIVAATCRPIKPEAGR